MNQVRMAIIGIGQMGKKYAKIIDKGLVKEMLLTAVSCRSDENAKWVNENLSNEIKVIRSSDELFEQSDLFDAVLIVTPHKTHPELAVQAFKHKKHVFCDKPAGVSLLQAQWMNEAAKESGMKYAMMFHQRLLEKYIRLKEILEQNELGDIKRVMLENSRYYRTKYYHESGSWRSSWTGEGGGVLINQGQHLLDIWVWLFGMPKTVSANITFGKYNDIKVEDEATIYMQYPNNMSAVFMITTGEPTGEERLEIVGSKGKLLLEDNHLKIWKYEKDIEEYAKNATVTDEKDLKIELSEEEFESMHVPYVEMLQNFADAILEDATLAVLGEEGSKALEIANASYLSAWNNKIIQIPIDASEYEKQLASKMEQENHPNIII